MDISDSMVLQIKSFLSMIHGQNSVEPYLKAALTSRNKDLQDFFTVSRVTFKKTTGRRRSMSTSLSLLLRYLPSSPTCSTIADWILIITRFS